MTVHALRLVWKRGSVTNAEDIELGVCFNHSRPVAGELIAYSSEHGGMWRVTTVYHQPFMPHSPAWNDWQRRGSEPTDMTHYWVEPAEGPWEP